MTTLVVLTVVVIAAFVAGLAVYLFWAGTLLARVAANLEESAQTVGAIVDNARVIGPGVSHINETGGVVAGALPLLYGMAEQIVTGVTPPPAAAGPGPVPAGTVAAPGPRRSRLHDAVGFTPR